MADATDDIGECVGRPAENIGGGESCLARVVQSDLWYRVDPGAARQHRNERISATWSIESHGITPLRFEEGGFGKESGESFEAFQRAILLKATISD